jgi:hypothetical protein
MTDNLIVTIARAYDFAARKHVDQRRKGTRGEPYIGHCCEVAALVAEATDDPEVVIAAVLHDVLEDCGVTPAELKAAFGERVAGIVAECTDDKSLDKDERKHLQIQHAAHASPGAKLVKIADKVSNLRSLRLSPPDGWPPERIVAYVTWAGEVVARCRSASPLLATQFDAAAKAFDTPSPMPTLPGIREVHGDGVGYVIGGVRPPLSERGATNTRADACERCGKA